MEAKAIGAVAAGIYDFRRLPRVIFVLAVLLLDWRCLGAPPPPITVVGGCKAGGSESHGGSPTRPLAARSSSRGRQKYAIQLLPGTTLASVALPLGTRQQAWRREPFRRALRRPLSLYAPSFVMRGAGASSFRARPVNSISKLLLAGAADHRNGRRRQPSFGQ